MPSLFRLTLLILCVLLPVTAEACMQCISRSPLPRTVDQASVIALVVNNDRNSAASLESGPEIVNLTVLKVYKGSLDEGTIPVHSWYGECAYGVHMGLYEQAIVMIQEMNDINTGGFDGTYKLVEEGCSEGQLSVRNGKVRVKNSWQTIEDFQSTYLGR